MEGQFILPLLRLSFIASPSKLSFVLKGRKLLVSLSQLTTSPPVKIASVSLSLTASGSSNVSIVDMLEGIPLVGNDSNASELILTHLNCG